MTQTVFQNFRPSALFFAVFIFTATCLFFSASTAAAQGFGSRVPFSNASNPSAGRRVIAKAAPNVVVKKQVIKIPVIRQVKTTNLVVASEAGAKVLLTPEKRAGQPMERTVPADKSVEFENIAAGNYLVKVMLDGFKTGETDVDVEAQKTQSITVELEPVTYPLEIETNINEGEIRYAPARLKGTKPDGSLDTEETAGFCIAKIKNNRATIPDLKKGYYNLDIRPATTAIEYEIKETYVNFPVDVTNTKGEIESSRINLDTKISTEIFSTAFSLEDWNVPPGWRLQSQLMKTDNVAGVATPKNTRFRYYADFELKSYVRSLDGKTVGFALRARDNQNYYLAQFSGANAMEKFQFSFSVVRDGKIERLKSQSLGGFASTIAPGKNFSVTIRAVGNKFTVSIEDSETGNVENVGIFEDPFDNSFRKGAVGVAGQANSSFEVGFFQVTCLGNCRQP